jgi:hypothetical protein
MVRLMTTRWLLSVLLTGATACGADHEPKPIATPPPTSDLQQRLEAACSNAYVQQVIPIAASGGYTARLIVICDDATVHVLTDNDDEFFK